MLSCQNLLEIYSLQKALSCIHTSDLLLGNRTSDKSINEISIQEKRIVITKDSDFLKSFFAKKEPYKLIFRKLGNTSKNDLFSFFMEKFDQIITKIEA